MNAAARLVHQNVLSKQLVLTYLLTRRQMVTLLLILAILVSGLAMVYVSHESRMLYASYQHNLAEQSYMRSQQSQLLLERATLMRQSRVQTYAEQKLDMIIPDHQSVVIIRE